MSKNKSAETLADVAAEAIAEKAHAATINGATGEIEQVEGAAPVGLKLVAKRHVTVPLLKFPDGAKVVFSPTKAIYTGKALKEGQGTKAQQAMEPAEILTVQLMTGEVRQIVCGAVLKSELQEAFPDANADGTPGYVGAWLYVHKIAPQGEKRYATYEIIEIEKPEQAVERSNTLLLT